MLAKGKYEKTYIARCRKDAEGQLALWKKLAKKSPGKEIDALGPAFMTDLVLVIDSCFAHRTRGVEGKDGNPVNEVTILRDSIHESDGIFTENKTIKYKPENSVLGLEYGNRIELSEADLSKLLPAFFDEMETRFTG